MKLRTALTGTVLAATTAALTVGCSGGSSGSSTTTSSSSGASGTSSGSAAPAAFQAAHKGGTLHLVAKTAGGTLDPQVNYTAQYWQLYQGVYDGLLAFRQVPGSGSFTVVPDLAAAMPAVSDGGKTYTFTLRKGVAFSTGAPVTTDDVVASFTRIFQVSSPTAGTFYNGIVGADACLATPATCTLPQGVVGDAAAGTVAIHLTAPDPEFIYKLSVPHAAVLPKGSPTQDAGSTPLPGTGAYTIASHDPNRALVMKRNPHFTEWSRDAQPQGYPDEIDETFGLTVEAEVTAVQNGQADWIFDPPPTDRLGEIGTKYAAQAHVNPLTAMWYLAMNTNLAPFNDLRARQAVNWAVDRAAAVQLYGGKNLAQPVCTILPPGFPGHVDDCQYTKGGGKTWTAPDLDKAKALVQASGTAGQEVAVVTADDEVAKALGQAVQSTLTSIGYKATLKPISQNIQFTYIQNTNNKVQISLSQWYQDYPAASDFLNVLTSCASFHPGSDSSINIPGFCDKGIDAQLQQALTTEQSSMDTANTQWAAIDKAVMTASPMAPLFTPKQVDFVSKRVGNYQFSKQFHMLLDQAWVQ